MGTCEGVFYGTIMPRVSTCRNSACRTSDLYPREHPEKSVPNNFVQFLINERTLAQTQTNDPIPNPNHN